MTGSHRVQISAGVAPPPSALLTDPDMGQFRHYAILCMAGCPRTGLYRRWPYVVCTEIAGHHGPHVCHWPRDVDWCWPRTVDA